MMHEYEMEGCGWVCRRCGNYVDFAVCGSGGPVDRNGCLGKERLRLIRGKA
jgi:hypothetical protein